MNLVHFGKILNYWWFQLTGIRRVFLKIFHLALEPDQNGLILEYLWWHWCDVRSG